MLNGCLDGFRHVSSYLHHYPHQPPDCHDVWHLPEDPAAIRHGVEVWIFKTYHVSFIIFWLENYQDLITTLLKGYEQDRHGPCTH